MRLQPTMLLNALYNYKTRQFVRRRVREHRDTFDGENVRDFVDLYLQAERSAEADPAYTGNTEPADTGRRQSCTYTYM